MLAVYKCGEALKSNNVLGVGMLTRDRLFLHSFDNPNSVDEQSQNKNSML